MEQLTLIQIAKAVGSASEHTGTANAISIDSRKITKGCLFIAIKGERFDGHDFIRDAFSLGAAAVITQHEVQGGKNIIVPDTKQALIKLAAYYRRLFNISLVGITGSVGKTTTKEMISCVLSSRYKTLKTQGNLNNDIGLPLTLMELSKSHEAAVIEMGMSDFGEISVLSKTAKPNIAVITNIGYSHIETLGSREGILKAKLEILDGLGDNGTLILNADDPLLFNLQYEMGREIIYYGVNNEVAAVRATNIQIKANETRFDIVFYGKVVPAVLPATGAHNILNALAAFCVGIASEIEPAQIVKSFLSYKPADMRQNIVKKGEQTLIVDCYNASPTSMTAAIDVLASLPAKGKRVAVIGDMLELGSYSEQLHRDIADKVNESNVDMLLCYGKLAAHTKTRASELKMKSVSYFDNKEQLVSYLKRSLGKDDLVLFKASRGMELEKVIEQVYEDNA